MVQKAIAQSNTHPSRKFAIYDKIYNVKQQSRERTYSYSVFVSFFSIKENNFQAGTSRTNIIRRKLKCKIGAEIIREYFTALN